ncbi:hypothetical protein JCM10207_008390 [Rhodosporidiobolus poonsookiae]
MTNIPPTLDYPIPHPAPHSRSTSNPAAAHTPASTSSNLPSPAASVGVKRKASEQGDGAARAKGKGKEREVDDGDSDDEPAEGRKKKRNRMALSCKECKRRKIKCDRVMPVCGNCTKRGRPSDCTWDVFQPANDAFLPPSLARTTDLEQLAARLAHVESYLKTLPPNFALFRPLPAGELQSRTAEGVGVRKALTGAKDEREEGYSDTEDAAVTLENGVFNGRIELDPTSTATPVKSASTSARPLSTQPVFPPPPVSYAASQPPPRFGAPAIEFTKALTSIVSSSPPPSSSLKAMLPVEFDASVEELQKARKDEVERILRALPGREATVFLVDRYFNNVAWLFHHVHAPTFRAELDFFHSTLCDTSRSSSVDLFWLSLLLMILCLALDSMHFKRSPLALSSSGSGDGEPLASAGEGEGEGDDPLRMYSDEQRRKLPERWFAASMRALKLAEWETVPRVRSIQTIILFTQYLQLSSASRGQPSQMALWLAGAIRLAQVLGLHLLGSNPETMPPEDPAWPPGRNSLKREMAKRLWAVLVYQDWLGANSRTRSYQISPHHFDTDDPLNVNDADLSPSTTAVQSAPSTVLTDSSADRVRIAMARQVRAVFDRVVLAREWTYETVLELDAGFRAILDELPERWTLAADEQEQPMLRFQRHFVLEGLHNRIFRLHRPLLSKAGKNSKYKYSAEACLKSARAVVVSTHNIRDAVADIPYVFAHVLGASLVLFNDLFQAIDHDLSAPEISSKISTLHLALEIFSSKPTSASLDTVVQQGHRILSGLFREEERRRDSRAARALLLASTGVRPGEEGAATEEDEEETFAEVLHRIARSLNSDSAPHRGTPPPTRNIPTKKGGGAPGGRSRAGAEQLPVPPASAGGAPTDGNALPPDSSLLSAFPPSGPSSSGGALSTGFPTAAAPAPAYPLPVPASNPLFSTFNDPSTDPFSLQPSSGYARPASSTNGGFASYDALPGGVGSSSFDLDIGLNLGLGGFALDFGDGTGGGGFGSLGMGMMGMGDVDLDVDMGLGLGLGLGGGAVQENGGGAAQWSEARAGEGAYGAPGTAQGAVQGAAGLDIAQMSAEQFWGTGGGQ